MDTSMKRFLEWLDDRCRDVLELETQAQQCLAENKTQAYRDIMHRKARLLADLPDQAGERLTALPPDTRRMVADRLQAFAASARNALKLDSVFYMSALLFPEDHRPGMPNDLEVFRDTLSQQYH